MINVDHVKKSYGPFHLDVSFQVDDGCIMGLIGRNGSGKTTTFKAILDLITIDGGTIEINGQPSHPLSLPTKSSLGVVMADSGFNSAFHLSDIDQFCHTVYPKWDHHYFHDFITTYQLPWHKPISQFSTGMNVLVKLAVALSHGATTLILDEPTSGLDVIARNAIIDRIRQFMALDPTNSVLISSHISSDLSTLVDRIALIDQGSIIFTSDIDTLDDAYGIIKVDKTSFDAYGLNQYPHQQTPWGYMVLTTDRQSMIRSHPDWIIEKATIDDLMVLLVGKEEK